MKFCDVNFSWYLVNVFFNIFLDYSISAPMTTGTATVFNPHIIIIIITIIIIIVIIIYKRNSLDCVELLNAEYKSMSSKPLKDWHLPLFNAQDYCAVNSVDGINLGENDLK